MVFCPASGYLSIYLTCITNILNNMLSNWDFIDPKLARRLKQLHEELEQLKKKRSSILANPHMSSQSKQKLLSYNDKCMKDLMQMFNQHKQGMIDYFDSQLQVLTKKQEDSPRMRMGGLQKYQHMQNTKLNSNTKSQSISDLMLTKLVFDNSIQNSYHESKRGQALVNEQEKSMSIQNSYKLQRLDTTGRFTNTTLHHYRQKTVRSFDQTLKNGHTKHQYSKYQHLQPNLIGTQRFFDWKNSNKRYKKAKISFRRCKRMKRLLQRKQLEVQLYRIINRQTTNELKQLKRQSIEDKQLIELLYQKISLMEVSKKKQIEQERKKSEGKYERQLEQLKQKYIDLSSLQQKNRELMAKRKEMLKMGQNL